MKRVIVFCLIAITVFSSCKKDDSNGGNSGCELTAANVAGSYKVTAIKYKSTSTAPEIDAYSLILDDCQKDDIYVLNTNGTLNYNDAGVQCAPPGTYTGTWNLTGTTLTIDGQAFAVTSFNCTTAVGTINSINFPGDQATFTFTKQ